VYRIRAPSGYVGVPRGWHEIVLQREIYWSHDARMSDSTELLFSLDTFVFSNS